MLAWVGVGLSIGLFYVIVPAPIDLVAAHRAMRFGPCAGIAAQFGSMAADSLCAVLALCVLLPLTEDPRLQTSISITGMVALLLVIAGTTRAIWRIPGRVTVDSTAAVLQLPPYRAHAAWGALATIASPFPLAYWLSLGRMLAQTSTPARWTIGASFLVVDMAWAIGLPCAAVLAPRILPATARQCGWIRAALIAVAVTVFFGAQLASTII